RGIEDYVREPSVRVDILDVLPGASAIGGSEKPSITTCSPQGACRSSEDDLRTRRMDNDASDVLRLPESHVRPRLSTILRLVDSISPRRAALVVRLARSNPNDVRIARRNGDVTNRCSTLMIEDWLPGRSAIRRFPDSS